MKTIKFEKFQIDVPEKQGESYRCYGDAPKKVKGMVKILNVKTAIIPAKTVANMVAQDVGQPVKEII